jgi:hypothetical protein
MQKFTSKRHPVALERHLRPLFLQTGLPYKLLALSLSNIPNLENQATPGGGRGGGEWVAAQNLNNQPLVEFCFVIISQQKMQTPKSKPPFSRFDASPSDRYFS